MKRLVPPKCGFVYHREVALRLREDHHPTTSVNGIQPANPQSGDLYKTTACLAKALQIGGRATCRDRATQREVWDEHIPSMSSIWAFVCGRWKRSVKQLLRSGVASTLFGARSRDRIEKVLARLEVGGEWRSWKDQWLLGRKTTWFLPKNHWTRPLLEGFDPQRTQGVGPEPNLHRTEGP